MPRGRARQRRAPSDQLIERIAFQELHHDEQRAAMLAKLEDGPIFCRTSNRPMRSVMKCRAAL
jgi:hypothetical protein